MSKAYYLLEQDGRLRLYPQDKKKGGAVFIDFAAYYRAYQREQMGIRQDIAKAVGCKPDYRPHVLDATTGLAADASLLAYLGCKVDLLEQNDWVYPLISDAFKHADAECPMVENLQLLAQQDAIHYMQNTASVYDAVYLDPMFPERQKSAKVKKAMQYLHDIVGIDDSEVGQCLLQAAFVCAAKRVVVKRPKLAPFLADNKPHFQISGKVIRFDVYQVALL